jgi:uncharacterized protein YecE (DUF72 family)
VIPLIRIGLAGWGDHDALYRDGVKAPDKLKRYSEHFPVVEVDSSFYAVQPAKNYERWAEATPEDFGFVVKAYQGMTGHLRGKSPYPDKETMFLAFQESIRPLQAAGKLKAVLFQFPPWFDCTRANVSLLRQYKQRMEEIPVMLEFRHQSWFTEEMREKTLDFMVREGWIHSICDEPQAGPGSVPTVLVPTNDRLTLVRFHGRNESGWNSGGSPTWRDVRYLYRYNTEELTEWKEKLLKLEQSTKEVVVIFNNNSGGDAAGNAKELMSLLGLQIREDVPQQLDLFET